MDANLEALRRTEAAIESEVARHRRNLRMLTNAAEILRALVGDKASAAEVMIKVISDSSPIGVADDVHAAARSFADGEPGHGKGKTGRKSSPAVRSNSTRRIVNIEAPAKPKWGRTAGATRAIKEAISYFGNEVFTTGQILTYVRQHHPEVPLDAGTVAKRMFQLRNADFIEVVVKTKPGARSPQTYKRTPT